MFAYRNAVFFLHIDCGRFFTWPTTSAAANHGGTAQSGLVATPPAARPSFLLVLRRARCLGAVTLLIRQSIVELESLFQERQCAKIIAWAEQQGFVPTPGDSESPAFARCVADEGVLMHLWLRLAGAIEAATGRTAI